MKTMNFYSKKNARPKKIQFGLEGFTKRKSRFFNYGFDYVSTTF
jgi:hypothetical protein